MKKRVSNARTIKYTQLCGDEVIWEYYLYLTKVSIGLFDGENYGHGESDKCDRVKSQINDTNLVIAHRCVKCTKLCGNSTKLYRWCNSEVANLLKGNYKIFRVNCEGLAKESMCCTCCGKATCVIN